MDPPPPDLVLEVDQNNHNNEDDSDSAPLSDDANLDELLGEMEVAGVCQVGSLCCFTDSKSAEDI